MKSENKSFIPCPVCQHQETVPALKVKDHSVSKEYFDVYECPRCTLRLTKDAPADIHIGRYYQSEDYISHSNTRKGIINSLYHRVRNHTMEVKCRLLKKMTGLQTGVHLDVGAGTGAFVQHMNENQWTSTGLEPDEKAREVARSMHRTILLPAGELNHFEAGTFDAITLWHVLEHVHELYPYMQQLKKILKPGGLIFIAVPNYTSYDGVKYGSDWAAYDVPRHLYHFSPKSMKWLFKESGFQVKKIVPMWWDSFYISLLSEKYKTGHSSLVKGFFYGGLSDIKAFSDKEKCGSLIYIAGKN
jgi:2-polyprenyl-3-methyl-5-hydroxy-6-metoxy-1,4-benzoquinol methylase